MITAIAIDDEPKALEIIQLHAEKVPFLNLSTTFRDALSALDWLQENRVDVVFLDINMPNLSGLRFRELTGPNLMIIFTTAYSEYAVESYEQQAVDYLLKPIRFPRFLQAVLKAREYHSLRSETDTPAKPGSEPAGESILFIKSGNKHYQLNTAELLYLEKDGNYLHFHTPERKVMARMSMQQVLDLLPESQFVRVHKSWVANLKFISVVEPGQLTINKKKIPIGKMYRDELMKRVNG